VVHFFRDAVGIPAVNKEVLSRRTADYQNRRGPRITKNVLIPALA
jgi:hypothetical protein